MQDEQENNSPNFLEQLVSPIAKILGHFETLVHHFEKPIKVEFEEVKHNTKQHHLLANQPWTIQHQNRYLYLFSNDTFTLTVNSLDNPTGTQAIIPGWNSFTKPPGTSVTSAADYQVFLWDSNHRIEVTASASSGGGAVTMADGANVTQGAKADAAYTSGSGSVISILKGIFLALANPLPVSGTVTANQGGSWTVTANAGTNLNTSALALETGGNLALIKASLAPSSTSALTQVSAATSDTQLLAANAARKRYSLFNTSTSILTIAESSSVSTTAYTTQIAPSTLWESPMFPQWQGAVHGIWGTTNGNVQVTEYT